MSPQQAKIMSLAPWVIGPISFFITWKMSALVQVFFAATAVLQYIQTTLWHIPVVRRACGLPSLEEMTAAAAATPSLFGRARGAPQYQAPRTVSTTATPQAGSKGSDSPVEAVRGVWGTTKEKWEQRNKAKEVKSMKAEATEYEKRRIREENEQYLRRRQAAARHDRKK